MEERIKTELGTGGNNDGGRSGIQVRTGGVKPPRLTKCTVVRREIVWFLRAYDSYVKKMKVANEDGGGRSVAKIRELVPDALQRLIARRYYQSKMSEDLTEAEVREGLEKLGGLDAEEWDEETFEREVVRITKMDGELHVTDRILGLEMKLERYVGDRNLEGVAVTRGKWTPEHGQVVVNALLDGIVPPAFRTTVRKSVAFNRAWDDPEAVFKIMY